MVGKVDYTGVPTSVDLENNGNQKKYTVNHSSGQGILISKPLCTLMAVGAVLLAVLVGLIVFFCIPRHCDGEKSPEALTNPLTREKIANAVEVDERLPRSIEPTKYRVQIIPNLQNSTTSGAVAITLNVLDDTKEIILHAKNISVSKESVSIRSERPDASPIEVKDQQHLDGDRYKITLGESLKKGELYQLGIRFVGELNGHLQGFYRSKYHDETGQERFVASTQFSPTDARRAFPCFDEPSFKATFTISLARPENMTTLSNMPLGSSDAVVEAKNWVWDHYPETPKMSTYLVAFLEGDLKHSQANDSLIKVWSRNNLLEHTKYASSIAPNILRYFEEYFGMKFPLQKIDIVAVPEFGFSAMENWGLITFRESSLLFDRESSTIENKRTIATILAHEIAHQWFGNLVTPKWWKDLWLKEGFATYLQYLGVNAAEPMWKILEEFLPSESDRAMAKDALETSRPISFEVKNSNQIRQTFDEISYSKGACIIKMMNHFLGENVVKSGLINYLQKFQYGNADRQDLFTALSEEAHRAGALLVNETVGDIMDTWTDRPGFPVITAVADYNKNRLRISQKRFLLSGKNDESSWWVPISFATDRVSILETTPKFWLRGEAEIEEDVELGKWYLLNINHTGYFIVNYDEENWKALVENIMNLPSLTRADLISDAMDLARANLLSYDIPLRMIAKMAVNDRNIMFVPTLTALNKLKFLSDILSETPAYGYFEEYHKAIFKTTYQVVSFDNNIDDYLTQRIRKTVLEWSCRNPDSRCAHESKSKFRQWMINDRRVEPNLREIVYCTAVRDGGEMEWDFAYNKYLETTSPSEKNVLLDSLGCTRLKWLLSRYIEKLTHDNSIRIQDADRVFESVANNKIGLSIAFDFLRKNWHALLNRYGDGFNILAKMIKSLAAHMNTEFQLSELERFRDSIKGNLSTTATAFDTAIETVKANVGWMEKNYNQVEDWFKKHKEHFAYI